ncbi:MAG: anti-sigma factor antagonist [Sporichthyaceae bacterium]
MPAGDVPPPEFSLESQPPPEEQLLTVSVTSREGAVVVTAIGEVDLLTVERLQAALSEAFARPDTHGVIVDLTDVTFFGSAGLRALLEARAEAIDRVEPLKVVVDEQRPVVRPIEITGLDRVLALYDTVADALAGTSLNSP